MSEITSLDQFTDAEAAKFLYRLVRDGMFSAERARISSYAELQGARESNTAASEEYQKNNEMGGWGYKVPYSEDYIKRMEQASKKKELESILWRRTLDFVVERFADNLKDK